MAKIGVVPARAGSKGIKDKNVIPIAGKSLISYTLEAALNSGCFDRIIVSSDSPAILAEASKYAVELLLRPEELATDISSSDVVIEHVLKVSGLNDDDEFMLLQPTSPLRQANQIVEAWKLYSLHCPQMLVSVFKLEDGLQKAFLIDDRGLLKGLLSEDAPFKRRQDLPDLYMPNGAIYICSRANFMRENRLPRTEILPYVMDKDTSVDIDDMEDVLTVEKILKERGL